jgi:hypothetical protein
VCYKSQLKSSRLRVWGDLRSITSNEQSHYKMLLPFVLTVQYFEIFVMNWKTIRCPNGTYGWRDERWIIYVVFHTQVELLLCQYKHGPNDSSVLIYENIMENKVRWWPMCLFNIYDFIYLQNLDHAFNSPGKKN